MTATLDSLILLPRPRTTTPCPGRFVLAPDCHVVCLDTGSLLLPVAEIIQADIRRYAGRACPISAASSGTECDGAVTIRVDAANGTPQAYRLSIDPNGITLNASDAAGSSG